MSWCNSNVATGALHTDMAVQGSVLSFATTVEAALVNICSVNVGLCFGGRKLHGQRRTDASCYDKGYSEAVKTRVERCAPVTTDVTAHRVFFLNTWLLGKVI